MRNFVTTAKIPAFLMVVLTMCLLTMDTAYGQNRKISGMVSDEAQKPLAGVSVMLKGTTHGVVTDGDGRYSLNVSSSKAVLVFSFTGYAKQEVSVSGSSIMNLSMVANTRQLSEVVVTAFGIEKNKKALGYSVQVLDGQKLSEAKELNVANALQGQVAGVLVNQSAAGPSGSTFVNIRGSSSLTGSNQPLYVVDGVPIDNETLGQPSLFGAQRDFGDGIGNINPDDIENISVLKGPAAASLYGARGANGVILITSKKGKAGKMTIDFNSNATYESLNSIPTFQNKYGGGYNDDYSSFNSTVVNGQTISQWPNWLQDNWGGKYDGRPISFQSWPEIGVVKYNALPANNFKNFYRTGSTYTNTVGVSGGSDRATYRVSVSDMENDGIVPNNRMDRQSINLLTNFKITDRLTVEAKVNYIREHKINPPETGGSGTSAVVALNRMPPFLNMNWLKNYQRADGSMINYKSGSPINPYWLMNEVLGDSRRDRVIGYVLAKYKFTDWLTLQGRAATDFYNDSRVVNTAVGTPGYSNYIGQVSENKYNVKEDNSDLLLTATGNLKKDISTSFSLGANHRDYTTDHLGVTGSGLNIPNLYNINNAQLVTGSQFPTQKIMNSVYFIGHAGYKDYLFLDITGRNDWSSTLGVNDYSFFYPSASGTFVFTDALKMNSSVLSFGKLRASYAEAGNDASPYQTQGGYTLTGTNFNGNPEATINSALPLADLKNELTKSYEFGTELKLFGNRLDVDFTYYHSSTFNQITPVQISAGTGFSTRLINAGQIDKHGIEVFISGAPVKTKDFRWDVIVNFSRNRSEVISLAPGISTLTLLDTYNGAEIVATPGHPFGEILGVPYLRNSAGQIVLNSSGIWQAGPTQQVMGNIQPDILGGLTNTFTYKNFSLSALIDVRIGGKVFSFSKYSQLAGGTGKFTENRTNLIANGVIDQGNGTYVKSNIVLFASDYYASSGPWSNIAEPIIINAGYVALRQASLGYNIGRSIFLKKTQFRSAKLSIVGRNLFYLHRDPQFKTMGVSPETAFNTTFAAQGIESVGLPTTRSLGFNLSFSF